jgi:glycosyltransferase involved in cell wall biosynthesis
VVEALAVGTPVLATASGGVGEVVHDGENGLLVPLGDSQALGAALRRYFEEDGLRDRLRAAAAPSVAEYAPERIFAQLEEALQRVARTLAR